MKIKKQFGIASTRRLLITMFGAVALASAAYADDSTSGHSGLEDLDRTGVEQVLQVNPGFIYIPEADFDNDNLGHLSVWRFNVPVSYTIKTEPGDLRIGGFYEYSEYDTDNLDGTQDFNTMAANLLWKGHLNEEWGYFMLGGINVSASTHAAFSDGLTGMGGAGVHYTWNTNLSLGVGLAAATRLENDPTVLPIIALNWQINDRWNLRTLNGATITYDVTGDKKFLADFGLNFQRREYRLRFNNNNSAMIDRAVMIELGATYRFTPQFALRGFTGVAVARNIGLRNHGDKVTDQDVDSAPIIGVRAMLTF